MKTYMYLIHLLYLRIGLPAKPRLYNFWNPQIEMMKPLRHIEEHLMSFSLMKTYTYLIYLLYLHIVQFLCKAPLIQFLGTLKLFF
jgi:hypothetical protein